VKANNDFYGGNVSVEMGAHYHNANDHNFLYSIPGECKIRSYRQDTASTWTCVASLNLSAPAMCISNDSYNDHLFLWDEDSYCGRYYKVWGGGGFSGCLDTFAQFGCISYGGGVNGIGWISGDVLHSSASSYDILVGIQSAYDAYVEMFCNGL
jgi:hypothetical protein